MVRLYPIKDILENSHRKGDMEALGLVEWIRYKQRNVGRQVGEVYYTRNGTWETTERLMVVIKKISNSRVYTVITIKVEKQQKC